MGIQKYHVVLSDDDQQAIRDYQKNGSEENKKMAAVLVALDESGGKTPVIKAIAGQCGVTEAALRGVRKKFAEQGLAALFSANGKKPRQPAAPIQPEVIREVEAKAAADCYPYAPKQVYPGNLRQIAAVISSRLARLPDDAVRKLSGD